MKIRQNIIKFMILITISTELLSKNIIFDFEDTP